MFEVSELYMKRDPSSLLHQLCAENPPCCQMQTAPSTSTGTGGCSATSWSSYGTAPCPKTEQCFPSCTGRRVSGNLRNCRCVIYAYYNCVYVYVYACACSSLSLPH